MLNRQIFVFLIPIPISSLAFYHYACMWIIEYRYNGSIGFTPTRDWNWIRGRRERVLFLLYPTRE